MNSEKLCYHFVKHIKERIQIALGFVVWGVHCLSSPPHPLYIFFPRGKNTNINKYDFKIQNIYS